MGNSLILQASWFSTAEPPLSWRRVFRVTERTAKEDLPTIHIWNPISIDGHPQSCRSGQLFIKKLVIHKVAWAKLEDHEIRILSFVIRNRINLDQGSWMDSVQHSWRVCRGIHMYRRDIFTVAENRIVFMNSKNEANILFSFFIGILVEPSVVQGRWLGCCHQSHQSYQAQTGHISEPPHC